MSRLPPLLLPLALLLAVLSSRPAHADIEQWNWFEHRMPVLLVPNTPTRLLWRFQFDLRFAKRFEGPYQFFARSGPFFEVNKHLTLAANGTVLVERLASGKFNTEYRLELEPWLHGGFGPLKWQDRNRLEVRFRTDRVRLRYRNMLRFNWAPDGARAIPFIWDEVIVDLSGESNHQNRLQAGVGCLLWPNTRLDLGVMLRTRRTDPIWTTDVIFVASLLVGPPRFP